MNLILPCQHSQYFLRHDDVVGGIEARTEQFSLPFIVTAYPNGMILIQKLELHHLLLFLNQICYPK